MRINEHIYTIALKNIDILQANIARLSSYAWLVKGWTITAWSATFGIASITNKSALMYSIVTVGFITAEIIRVLEHLTIERAIKLERAISMAMLGQTKSLYLHGFSSNLKSLGLDDFIYVLKKEKFSITRVFFIIAFLGTALITKYFL